MGRPTHGGGRSPQDLPARDWIGGYRPRVRAAARPAALWAGLETPEPAPYLAPGLEEELLDLTESHPGEAAGVVFGYAGRDAADPYVVAVRVLPFPRVEPIEGGLRIPRQSWWALSQTWQAQMPELEPVGWFRIQPGRGTSLGSYDRFTAYQRFADPLQFTWVLDPEAGRQALYRWEGSDLVPVPGYWRCTEAPRIPPREPARRSGVKPVVRRSGALAGIAALKPLLLFAAAAAAVYLALPSAPGSIPSLIRTARGTPPQPPPALAETVPPTEWLGTGSAPGPRAAPAAYQDWSSPAGTGGDPAPAVPALPPAQVATGVEGSAPAAPAPPGEPYATYQVRRGDTLWRISLRLLGDPTRYGEIAALNGITEPRRLQAGQVLRIPVGGDGALK